ncbi:hypothetical protein CH354_03210 [Leptospira levettii]|uniref:DUF3995 domain-containing protein n=1 Tax=Leptospira levettii TaxID=2023178 RepID=UPI000C296D81|nr:DUF3995 domain-containing protein [Leptospira levettii]MCW7473897.1 DUF3995 domain-containing protein [Leptospira levettii]PJZ38255.1 hypothetical protein CH354_03210 [Leptospira levettii]PJZ87982.1 hypothetical protein CH368_14060 [Leptospira levettii]PKA00996.1 hypothetical protein CH369_04115 [Leptospira levettii]TGM36384.1 DUF3995 domain-containing protein [Leptospira levettii]
MNLNLMIVISTSLLLILLASIHIYWAFGGLWPGKNKQDLNNKVFGRGNYFPSPFSCFVVAIGLFLFSCLPILWLVRSNFGLNPQSINMIRYGKIFVAIVFLLRGLLGYLPWVTKYWVPIFVFYTKRIYNPISLLIGISFLIMSV